MATIQNKNRTLSPTEIWRCSYPLSLIKWAKPLRTRKLDRQIFRTAPLNGFQTQLNLESAQNSENFIFSGMFVLYTLQTVT